MKVPEEYLDDFDWSNDYQLVKKTYMTWKPIISAILSAVIIAVLGYVLSLGDLWKLDLHVLATVAFGAFATSLLKFIGTTQKGNFAGVVPIAEPK